MPIIDANDFLNIALERFGRRFDAIPDFHALVNVPKCERWFTTETITALIEAKHIPFPPYRIYGEESYKTLLQTLLGESDDEVKAKANANDLTDTGRKPDITIIETKQRRIELVVEAKVVYHAKDGALSDANGQLINQLERAVRLCPSATVLGLVFVIYSPQTFEEVSPFTEAIDQFVAYLQALREKESITGFRATVDSFDQRLHDVNEEFKKLRGLINHEIDTVAQAFSLISTDAKDAHEDATDPEVPTTTYGLDPERLFEDVRELIQTKSAGKWSLVGDKIHPVPNVQKVGSERDSVGTASLGIGVVYRNL